MLSSLNIAIYAAIVSTLVFLWRIFEFFYDRYPKIKIDVGQFIEDNNHYCIIQITNQSKEKKFVERPSFVADKVFKENGTIVGFPFLVQIKSRRFFWLKQTYGAK